MNCISKVPGKSQRKSNGAYSACLAITIGFFHYGINLSKLIIKINSIKFKKIKKFHDKLLNLFKKINYFGTFLQMIGVLKIVPPRKFLIKLLALGSFLILYC